MLSLFILLSILVSKTDILSLPNAGKSIAMVVIADIITVLVTLVVSKE